jgi:ATPase subunit of ABC transporter with duplicated ATPase domains
MSESAIVCSNLSFSWPGEAPLFDGLSFTVGDGRTGLVAPNGAGKSTLLKLITGEYRPSAGSVTVDGTVGYLAQTLPFEADRSVAEVLGVAPVLDALDALAGGDARDEVFTAIGDDWDVEERTRAQLDRLGLGHVALDRGLGSLSGGEVVSLGLAAELLRRPEVLLLDEPTNNLDADARAALYDALDDYPGVLLVVSHDRALLDRMDRIAELHRGEMLLYGGNFTAYEDAVREGRRVAESTVRNAEQQLKREKRQMQEARERAARRSSTAKRNAKDAGIPKIILGAMKRRAQESAGRIDGVNAARVDDARTRLDDAERSLRDDPLLVLDLPQTEVPAGRDVFVGNGLRASRGGRALFGDGIDLSIRGPERIALVGPNGAGKTTLLRIISGDVDPDEGTVHRVDGRIAYLSQRLDHLDPDRSVLENFLAYAPTLSETRRMHVLAQFLFTGSMIHLPMSALSGGERLRATLACVLFAEPPPQLLLLDEPTNNLDLVSVAQLESALNTYRGAFVVVSHDARFLDGIRLDRTIRLP